MDDSTLNFHAYAATLQQVMADAIQKAEDLQAEANAEREAMFADQEKNSGSASRGGKHSPEKSGGRPERSIRGIEAENDRQPAPETQSCR